MPALTVSQNLELEYSYGFPDLIFSILRNDVRFIHLYKEQCILVNENDQELGSASKRTCHLKDPFTHKAPLHRAFSLFIFNKENQLLLQQRSDTKVTFPGKTSI